MKRSSGSKSQHGREPITEVAQIPFALIQAQTSLSECMAFVDGDERKELIEAYNLIHSVLVFLAIGDCDWGALQLTDAQKEAIKRIITEAQQ